MPSLQLSVVDGIAVAAAPPLIQETPPSTPPPPEPPRSNGTAFSLPPPPPQHPHSARSSPVDQHLTEPVDEKRAMSLGRVDPLVSPGKPGRSSSSSHSGAPSKIINWFRKKKADKTLSSPQGQ